MTAPLLIFPDVEATVGRYIRAALATRPEPYAQGVFVGNGVAPAKRRDRMVMVRNDGSTRLDLARLVGAIVWAAPDGRPLMKAEGPRGPYSVTDESEQPRYYLTFTVTVRATETS